MDEQEFLELVWLIPRDYRDSVRRQKYTVTDRPTAEADFERLQAKYGHGNVWLYRVAREEVRGPTAG